MKDLIKTVLVIFFTASVLYLFVIIAILIGNAIVVGIIYSITCAIFHISFSFSVYIMYTIICTVISLLMLDRLSNKE